ncbi:heparanase-like [Maniola jurtina]|uniref:heparanase-like n=1 Tax=Maniola jurtina TaxID=191418 RepID=UPI001E68B31A|nr:heparanase-like [Maniola jurtina]XP_045770962.1 heparanase-like [Maniola jurtina]
MYSNKRLVATCALIFCCNIALLAVFVKYNIGEKCYVTINEKQEVTSILPEDFLSIGIDASEIQNHDKVDFMKSKLRELAAALAPARLRLGGTMSDRLIFSKDDIPSLSCKKCPATPETEDVCVAVQELCRQKFLPFFIMTGNKWTKINEFCKATNLKLLFPLNVLIRNNEEWNDQNAIELLEYSKYKNFSIDWQLGNEPNSFPHVFNISISPRTLSHDYKKLRKLLNHHGYKKSWLVGPDTTRPQENRPNCLNYMVEFLGNVSHHINIRSWHQYYLNSRTAKLEDFWNPDTFDLLKEQIETMQNHTKKYRHIPMWLTETSSSYGGGAPGLSNSYAGSPLWIDKLGLSAKYNITTVIRQSFIGGNYSMIDDQLEPLPDWWVSVLFKRLVGNKVLHLSCKCSPFQRIYAHCANRKYTNDTTAITIYAINLQFEKAKFLLNGTAFHGDNLNIDEYIISAPSNNRRTKTVLLNGWPLYYDSSYPDLQPHRMKYGNHISMPPYSIGFWVVKNTSIKICK